MLDASTLPHVPASHQCRLYNLVDASTLPRINSTHFATRNVWQLHASVLAHLQGARTRVYVHVCALVPNLRCALCVGVRAFETYYIFMVHTADQKHVRVT